MPNYNQLIYTAADFKLLLLVPNAAGALLPFPLVTAQSFGSSHKTEDETIYAIGETDPIGEKTNGNQYTGKFEIQKGEMAVILKTTGYASPIQIKGAQLAITSYDGIVNEVYGGINVTSSDYDVKAKDKDTKVACNWKAVSLKSI